MESPQWKLQLTVRRRLVDKRKTAITESEVQQLQNELARRASEMGFDLWPGVALAERQNCPHCGKIIRKSTMPKVCPSCGRRLG